MNTSQMNFEHQPAPETAFAQTMCIQLSLAVLDGPTQVRPTDLLHGLMRPVSIETFIETGGCQ